MYCFIAGVDAGLPDAEERLERLIETVSEYEGLVEIKQNIVHPNLLLLCFDSKEAMTTAQWLLELNGAEPTKGGAGHEENTEYPGSHHGQPGNGAGDRNEPGGGTGGGL